MIATHTMKINGVLYRAGEVLPSPDEKPVEKPVEKAEESAKVEKSYTKSDIMTMKVADLRKLAMEVGAVEDADEYTGAELKEMLVDKLV